MRKSILMLILVLIVSLFLTSGFIIKANNKQVNNIDYDIKTVSVKNENDYTGAIRYKTSEPGYGFAFSISNLGKVYKVSGNALGVRIKNNTKAVAKIKIGLLTCDNPEGENQLNYMTNTSNGKNQNLAVKVNGRRTFIESRNGIIAIPAYFDGILYMPYTRFANLADLEDKYISNIRFGGALCDNIETDLFLYEAFDANVSEAYDKFDRLSYELYSVTNVQSFGTADTYKKADDVFWGGYSYDLGTPEKRSFDRSVTTIDYVLTKDINYVTYEETWIGDVKILESFANHSETDNDTSLSKIYSCTGAKHTLSAESIGSYNALGMLIGDWEEDYVNATFSTINVYSIDGNMSDWSQAKGVTLMVKNYEDHMVNMNVEFFGTESDGSVFRWAVNFPGARIYAYDVNTQEEYAFITNTRIFIPAHFEGWIRIPFTQYDPNTGVDPFSWVLELDRYEVDGVYIGSSMKTNSNCMLAFSNLGLYYESFKQESFFESNITSIKDCLEIENYKERLNDEK